MPTGARLAGEVAIVTGSTGRGTGTAIAKLFAAEGAQVVVTGRDAERGEAVTKEIHAAGGEAAFVRADLAERGDCDALAEAAVERFGKLTVLVNDATADRDIDAAIGDVDDASWAAAIQVSLTGFMYMCRAVIRPMLAAGHGSIVNITSRAAISGVPAISAYTACKGAQSALTRSIAMDYSRQGIRCNAVAPGFIVDKESDADLAGADLARQARLLEQLAPAHLTRMPAASHIAYAALYFASSESEPVTATELAVDGGGTRVRGLVLG